uniref:Uncharacterized protein n=1 Tax=Parascaris equorum TaxID=6256 RepID=A0A914R1W5_PAREQ
MVRSRLKQLLFIPLSRLMHPSVSSSSHFTWQHQKTNFRFQLPTSKTSSELDLWSILLFSMTPTLVVRTWLLYWPCTWSIALATPPGVLPSIYLLALFGAGSFFMRAAGCIINDIFDKKYDMKVERTRLRPLCSGELTNMDAVKLLSGLLSISLLILLQLNWLRSVFL